MSKRGERLGRDSGLMKSVCALLLAAACGKSSGPASPTASVGSATASQAAVNGSAIPALIERLRSKDKNVREGARDELHAGKFAGQEALEVLRASTTDFGDPPDSTFTTAAQLVLSVLPEPRDAAVVEELWTKWLPATRAAGLSLLSGIGDDSSIKTFVRLLPSVGPTDVSIAFRALRAKPHHAEVVVPALLALDGNDELHDEVYLTLLSYCDEHQLKPALIADRAPTLLAAERRILDDVSKRQHAPHGQDGDDYLDVRERASVLLDLLRCVPGDAVVTELTTQLGNSDPRLVFFAAKSMRALGHDVPDEALSRVAANAEMRNWLIQELQKTHELERIPARYRSQAAIAESEMVQWLAYPTELGHVPSAISLAKVISTETHSGVVDIYVFKIKTDDGWVAGLAGPYVRADEPTTDSGGATFSSFEPWDSKSPEEHAKQMVELVSKANERHAADKSDAVRVPDSDARTRKP
jgi:HEAT repeat protein